MPWRMMWWRICLNQELEQEEENNVLSGLALCLLEDGVCLMCVCVCACVCVSEVWVCVYVRVLCERDSVCVCMLIRVLVFHSVCFQCLLSILLSGNTSAAPLVSVHVTEPGETASLSEDVLVLQSPLLKRFSTHNWYNNLLHYYMKDNTIDN